MKFFKIYGLVVLLISGFTVFSQSAKFKFDTQEIDYGVIKKNSNGLREFVFTNIGDAPLIISEVKSTCGCTIAKKPNKPISPGEKGIIKVQYDTKRIGIFRKSIVVFSNATDQRKVLRLKGEVKDN